MVRLSGSVKSIISTLCVVALAMCGSVSARGVILAEDYPYSVIFVAMGHRAVSDYGVVRESFPSTLEDAAQQGYMPYKLPRQTKLQYSVQGKRALVSTGGSPVVDQGKAFVPVEQWASLRRPVPFEDVQSSSYTQVGDEMVRQPCVSRVWQYRGAEWVVAGFSWEEIELAMRFERLRTHILWAVQDYLSYNGNEWMPGSLEEIEAFVGAERNPAGWEGVAIVSSPWEVENGPGRLYIGDDGGRWVVKMNLGIEVRETAFKYKPGRGWLYRGTEFPGY